MELVRWEPFDGLNRIQSRINELFDDTFGRARGYQTSSTGVWFPPVDILESKDSYLIRAELPGMKKEDFHLEVKEGTLTLSGERSEEKEIKEEDFYRCERSYGRFVRQIALPAGTDADKANASFKDGVLEIELPLKETPKQKKIEVSAGG